MSAFEDAYEKLTGAKHCLATASGTAALYTVLGALDIGPGDEVIIPPYTFVATYNVVVLNYALPVFVDSDLESFQIDANKIEAAITKDTKAIMPVHIGGSPADLDKILAVAGKHKIPVVEDACQAHLAEWRGRKVGTLGSGRLLQLPGQQEPQLRRGRRRAHQRRPVRRGLLQLPQPGPGPAGQRLQLHLLGHARLEPAPVRVPGRPAGGPDDAASSSSPTAATKTPST